MEIEGLRRGLESMLEKGCEISTFITDRHVMVKKYMREVHSDIEHLFDVWHVAKGKFNLHILYCKNIQQ